MHYILAGLTTTEKIAIWAIIVPAVVAAVGGLFALLKWLFRKKSDPSIPKTNIQQKGAGHTAIVADGSTGNVAGRDIHTGIDSDAALNTLVKTSKELGRTEEEIIRLKVTIIHLEEQLAQSQALTGPGEQQLPQPTQQAKDLAAQIEDDAGPYAQALKAIAQGNAEKADELLDETQQLLDHVQQKKDEAQAKIYMARMQNASYAGRPQDALQYCDKLRPLAGNDTLILNEMAMVYYANAEYKEAEPLMKRVVTIFEKSLDPVHPNVAKVLNNLAALYQATNRLKEAEPLMERHLVIFLQFTRRTGHPHPHLEAAINNYRGLLMQMGCSKDEVLARLKSLAPEMFE